MKIDTKNESINNLPRRKLLKGMVAGGGGLTAVVATPERWTRPIVGSVILPAHAAISIVSVPESCVHNSTTIEELDEDGRDDIFIIYDGEVACDILIGDVSEGTQIRPDTVIVIDADPPDDDWDGDDDIGSNWVKTGQDYNEFDNPNGTYNIEVARKDNSNARFRVSFRVNISGNSMTVDNVVITAI